MRKSDFHIEIPDELIAQYPAPARTGSRLLELDGPSGSVRHHQFGDLIGLLRPGDRLVFNNTRVIPARLFGRKESGGRVEIMLERIQSQDSALVKIRASKALKPGQKILLESKSGAAAAEQLIFRQRLEDLSEIATADGSAIDTVFELLGHVPLPPYIERQADSADDQRYQTVYAREQGAVAAPTAGLHFSQNLLDELATAGINSSFVTLHVGAGTFQPVRVDDLDEHVMHAERYELSADTVAELEQTRAQGGRIIAVGTTSVRTLESAARLLPHDAAAPEQQQLDDAPAEKWLSATSGVQETRLFIKPGDSFRVIDGMITNFHLPESTLIMLVCAFAGISETLSAYQLAVEHRYRFYSYGDAMLVWPK